MAGTKIGQFEFNPLPLATENVQTERDACEKKEEKFVEDERELVMGGRLDVGEF